MWQCDYDIEINAIPEVIWEIFCDVPAWKKWNAGIEHIEINGPFEGGFKFVGSTIIYEHMQAVGMINDHLINCFRYNKV